jgi:hypothetical protein
LSDEQGHGDLGQMAIQLAMPARSAFGHVVDFLVDDADWSIRYIKVDTKEWWSGISVLMPPRSVRKIDLPNRLVHLDVDRQEVLNSSPYDPSKTADGAYDESFLTYYGIRWVEA